MKDGVKPQIDSCKQIIAELDDKIRWGGYEDLYEISALTENAKEGFSHLGIQEDNIEVLQDKGFKDITM